MFVAHFILFLGSFTSSYNNFFISDIFFYPISFFLSLIYLIFVTISSNCKVVNTEIKDSFFSPEAD